MELDRSDDAGYGALETVEHWGTWGANDDGTYELVIVAEGGYDCSSTYQLYIDTGS